MANQVVDLTTDSHNLTCKINELYLHRDLPQVGEGPPDGIGTRALPVSSRVLSPLSYGG